MLRCGLLMLVVALTTPADIAAKEILWDKDHYHPLYSETTGPSQYRDYLHRPGEGPITDWQELGQRTLAQSIQENRKLLELNHEAKNGIFLMGDGMGVPTLTAARVYMSQSRNLTGDEAVLSWENMPYMAMSKTYATDLLVSDSANTATAMMCGEKCRETVICANQLVIQGNCTSLQGNTLKSVLHHAIEAGKWTGFITTSSITDASPAVNYAHAPHRDWQTDADIPAEAEELCPDIAAQLLDLPINTNIRVILGGGRTYLTPNTTADPEYPDRNGSRTDNRNLIQEWKTMRSELEPSQWAYVENLTDFQAVDADQVEYLMGLFEPGDMKPERDKQNPDLEGWQEPFLPEMVETAIRILSKAPNGYFLFVEGGQIDSAHHINNAHYALTETVALSDAVEKALSMTNEMDTQIVVSADHSHVFNIAGYSALFTDILEYNDDWEQSSGFQDATDGKPYTILVYSNGPGYYYHRTANGSLSTWQPRRDLEPEKDELGSPDMQQDASIPRYSETHAGEDVAIFARGPMSYLFQGGQEQSYIAHVMKYSMCIGENKDLCDGPPPLVPPCSASSLQASHLTLLLGGAQLLKYLYLL